MSDPVRRIVSLVPSLTETVCDLGVSGRLVGATRFCVSPMEQLRFVPRVGGTKNPDLARVADLEPDLVLCNAEENRREDVAWLRERFPVYESMPRTVPEAAEVVRELGRLLEVPDDAEAILLEIEAQVLRAEVISLDREPLRIFYPIWRQPWISVNRQTYVHDVLTRAGARNVCAHRESRYPFLAPEDLHHLKPDLVLLPTSPFAFTREHREQLLRNQVFGVGVPILLVDGRNFCWHGSRSGRGLGSVANLIRPFRVAA